MDPRAMRMDTEFDRTLVDMKPYVLRMAHKTERQRCALWIKKLCEPVGSSNARNNRNMYAQLLLQMLKRGNLDGPFSASPETGPLTPLPSYMSMFISDNAGDSRFHGDDVYTDLPPTLTPDWAQNELKSPNSTGGLSSIAPPLHSTSKVYGTGDQSQVRFSPIRGLSEYRDTKGTTFRDEQSLIRMHEKEIEMKTKVLEAKYYEEKLKLQHKHDVAVQTILERKNSEIDELKKHFKDKEKEFDESRKRLDKKLHNAVKEMSVAKDANSKEAEDLKTAMDEALESLKTEFDTNMRETTNRLEREKYELQKSHTKSIQELLDETNQRLTYMEDEYNTQTQATKEVVSELEQRVSQLTQETESSSIAREALLHDKNNLENERDRLHEELRVSTARNESLQKELKSERSERKSERSNLVTKYEADMQYCKQENSMTALKAQETIRDLEDQAQNLKHAIQDVEQQRTREIREKDSLHQQDMMSIQHLHDKQLHSLRSEFDHDRSQHHREIKKLEDVIKDKDEQTVKLTLAQKQTSAQADQAIENYKKQVSDAQHKVFTDMKQQLEKMEVDLEVSRENRVKLQKEFRTEIEQLKQTNADEVAESKLRWEKEREQISQRNSTERDRLVRDYETQLHLAEGRLREALEEQERVAEERRKQNQEVTTGLEGQCRQLREELVGANATRRQQLVELGLLREEERQKAAHDHDTAVARLEAEIDRQRMEMHQQHAAELDRQGQKAKARLEQLDADYRQRLERAHERLTDAQKKEDALREEVESNRRETEEQMDEQARRIEEEQAKLKSFQNSTLLNVKVELESEREKAQLVHRKIQSMEFDHREQIHKVKLQCEERMKGSLPSSLKQDLEETISCLRSQVRTLQQRIEVLQDEVDTNRHRSNSPLTF